MVSSVCNFKKIQFETDATILIPLYYKIYSIISKKKLLNSFEILFFFSIDDLSKNTSYEKNLS